MPQVNIPSDFPASIERYESNGHMIFVMPTIQLSASEPVYEGDTITFTYSAFDSEEGDVMLVLRDQNGEDARTAEYFDAEIQTGSDCWDFEDTVSAINDALALHKALGRPLR